MIFLAFPTANLVSVMSMGLWAPIATTMASVPVRKVMQEISVQLAMMATLTYLIHQLCPPTPRYSLPLANLSTKDVILRL